MKGFNYGHRPPEVPDRALDMCWISGIRHLRSRAARQSHWHTHREMTLLCCLSGEFIYEFGGRDQIILSAGSFMVIPAGMKHRHAQAIDPPGLRIELLLESGRADRRVGHSVFSRAALKTLMNALAEKSCSAQPCPPNILPLFRRLATLSEGNASEGRTTSRSDPARWSECELAEMRIICSSILLDCATCDAAAKADDTQAVIDKVMPWMEAHLAEKIGIDDFVRHIGYSRTHVFAIFRKHTGLTPVDCLMRMRTKRARHLLETTDMKFSDIAQACGFTSAATFCAAFRKQCGLSPSEWRAKALAAAAE